MDHLAGCSPLSGSFLIMGNCPSECQQCVSRVEYLCRKSRALRLDTVSTTCDSGWVRSPSAPSCLRTHPLSQVVLTVSTYSTAERGSERALAFSFCENLYFKRFEVNSKIAFGLTNEPLLSLM